MLASEKLQGLAERSGKSRRADFQFLFSPRFAEGRERHGGGFVFDGRSLPNPGREERFKALTGKDAPVIDYLNQQESVTSFSQRDVVGGCQREQLPATRLQELDGVLRMHRRAASLGLSGRAVAKHFAPQMASKSRCAIWSWRSWANEGASMKPRNESYDSGRGARHAFAAADE